MRNSESRKQWTLIWKISNAKLGACTYKGCMPNTAGGAGREELGQTWVSWCEKAWLQFIWEIWLSFKNETKHKCTWERDSRSNSTKHKLLQWKSSVVFHQCPSQDVAWFAPYFWSVREKKGLLRSSSKDKHLKHSSTLDWPVLVCTYCLNFLPCARKGCEFSLQCSLAPKLGDWAPYCWDY